MYGQAFPFFTPQTVSASQVDPRLLTLLTALMQTGNNNPFDPAGGAIVRNAPAQVANPYGLAPTGFDIVRTDQIPVGPGQYVNPYGGSNPYYNPNSSLSPVEYDNPIQAMTKEDIMRMLGIMEPIAPTSKLDRGIMFKDRSTFMPQAPAANTGRNLGSLTIPSGVTGRTNVYQPPTKQPPIPYEPYKRY